MWCYSGISLIVQQKWWILHIVLFYMWRGVPLPSLPYFFICSGRLGSICWAILKFPGAIVTIKREIHRRSSIRKMFSSAEILHHKTSCQYFSSSSFSWSHEPGLVWRKWYTLLVKGEYTNCPFSSFSLCLMDRTVCSYKMTSCYSVKYGSFSPLNVKTEDAISQ